MSFIQKRRRNLVLSRLHKDGSGKGLLPLPFDFWGIGECVIGQGCLEGKLVVFGACCAVPAHEEPSRFDGQCLHQSQSFGKQGVELLSSLGGWGKEFPSCRGMNLNFDALSGKREEGGIVLGLGFQVNAIDIRAPEQGSCDYVEALRKGCFDRIVMVCAHIPNERCHVEQKECHPNAGGDEHAGEDVWCQEGEKQLADREGKEGSGTF